MEERNLTDQQNATEWQAPPPPEQIINEREQPQMSEAATLGSIFFEPGKTFEDLRRKPRFVLAGLIIIIFVSAFNFLFIQRVGFERIVRERMESNSRVQQMPESDKQKLIEQQSSPIAKTIGYAAVPVVMIIVFLIGGLIYWLGSNAMGGSARFSDGLAVWIYSSFPPTVIFILANILVLFLKSVDDIDILSSQNGLVKANPSFLISAKEMPVLSALLASIDLFAVWGWVLAVIGLQKIAKIGSASAWAIVLILALVGIAARVLMASFFS